MLEREVVELTGDQKIVKGHARKIRINVFPFHPPEQDILNEFGISAEVSRKLVTQLLRIQSGECWQFIKDVERRGLVQNL
jgi:hypothetical protein